VDISDEAISTLMSHLETVSLSGKTAKEIPGKEANGVGSGNVFGVGSALGSIFRTSCHFL
jgi:hypothetical protein